MKCAAGEKQGMFRDGGLDDGLLCGEVGDEKDVEGLRVRKGIRRCQVSENIQPKFDRQDVQGMPRGRELDRANDICRPNVFFLSVVQ